MTETTMIDILSKLGAASLLGVILYMVLMKVGTAIVGGIGRLADVVAEQTKAIAASTAALARVEAKLDHQLAMDRVDRQAAAAAANPPDSGKGHAGGGQ